MIKTIPNPDSTLLSRARLYGDLIFASGHLGVNPATGAIPSDIADEVRQSMENLKSSIEAGGGSIATVLKTVLFVTDLSLMPTVNEIYVSYFPPDHLPARSAMEISKLGRGGRFEIEAIAVKVST